MEALTALEVDRTIWRNHLLHVISSISQSHTLKHKIKLTNPTTHSLPVASGYLVFTRYLYFNGGEDLV